MNNMDFSLPHPDDQSIASAKKAELHLKELAKKWRVPIFWLSFSKVIDFIMTSVQYILIARFSAALVMGKSTGNSALKALFEIGLVLMLKPVCEYVHHLYSAKFSGKMLLYIRKELFQQMEQRAPDETLSIGAAVAAFAEKTEALLPYFCRYLPQLMMAVTVPLLMIGYIFTISPVCAIMMLLTVPAIPVYMMLIGKGTAGAAKEHWQNLSEMGGYFYDRLKGVITLYLYGQLPYEVRKVEHASRVYAESALKVLKIAFLSSAVLEFFSTIIIAGVAIYIGLSLVHYLSFGHSAAFTFADGLIILLLVPDFFTALKTLGTYYHDKAMAVGAVMSFRDQGLITDKRQILQKKEEEYPLDLTVAPTIRFIDLNYAYPGSPVLFRNLNLEIRAGEKIVLKGANGSGKSTLLSLLMRFNHLQGGDVFLDTLRIQSLTDTQLYCLFGWAGQHARIFEGTLRSNLLMGKVMTDQQLLRLLETYFDLDIFLQPFPEQLDTHIAEDGKTISGGERHKIALARVMIKNAPVLLLDEPFTHMDQAAIQKFMQSLTREAVNQTVILTAHGNHLQLLHQFRTIFI